MGRAATIGRWARAGRYLEVDDGRRIFTWELGDGPPLIALHGFPSSSRDWWELATRMPERRFIAFDFPGFGMSDKPPDGDYSISAYADIVEQVAKYLGADRFDLLAHDMGDSVAAELLARVNEGRTSVAIDRCILLNGSIFIDMARLTGGQKLLLRMKPQPMRFPLPVRPFRLQLRRTFATSPPKGTLETMEALLVRDGGARLLPITIRYIEDRRRNQQRYTDGLVEFDGELITIWGEHDPVSVPEMVDRLVGLRGSTTVVRWADVGHWPSIEAPERLADKLGRLLA